ncbi:hypothetical protein, partial [Paenibacillus chitinolyticus]|uniref:hypothetical protein n=1 Tax=Paenibacillus chitinolyticus TaxID=79263 RepID=UPI0036726B32
VNYEWSLTELREVAQALDKRLFPFLASKPERTRKIKSACNDVESNTRLAETADWDGPVTPASARHAAEDAFKRLLGYAYDWRRKQLATSPETAEIKPAR